MGPQPTFRPTPGPPQVDQARLAADNADMMRRRQGAAATFVSTAAARSTGGVATNTLLGQG